MLDDVDDTASGFDTALGCLVEPASVTLRTRLASVRGLGDMERRAVHDGALVALRGAVRTCAIRVLVLELNAARLTGRLTAPDPRGRWDQWIGSAATPRYWDSLAEHYPTLLDRLRVVIDNRCDAAVSLADRFGADRSALGRLVDHRTGAVAGSVAGSAGPGELVAVGFGAGDSHRGGRSVAELRCTGGTVLYKPRPTEVDAELARLLPLLLPDEPPATRIAVPEVVCRDGYGWAAHVAHRLCADDAELRAFHRGLGHWLAVMRLLGGSDLHSENVIAVGPVPVVVDCEALFTPPYVVAPSGYGLAVDRATELVNGSVLRTGLLPRPQTGLGWRGVDLSAVGSPSERRQTVQVPVVLDDGTDLARIGMRTVPVEPDGNRPSDDSVLSRYWDVLLGGFVELTEHLRQLDGAGRLEPMLAGFADRRVRVVLRGTDTYAELGHMLWHPSSLYDQPAAVAKAADLLARQGANNPGSPTDPEVIDAEIADLLEGDVPVFAATPGGGRLEGPRGTSCGPSVDRVAEALDRWRAVDHGLDRGVVRATLVSAYLNQGEVPDRPPLSVALTRAGDLDRRRRALAADLVRRLAAGAVHGADGTVTWVAPVFTAVGWIVQPLSLDVYSGLSGIAVVLAAYEREVAAGRADRVPEPAGLLDAVLHTIRTGDDRAAVDRRSDLRQRPEPPGGYAGIGSRVWSWLLLEQLCPADAVSDGVPRAAALAADLDTAVDADDRLDLLIGMAGAVVPLLRLAERTGDRRWAASAARIGERLASVARLADDTARWPTAQFADGIGGLSHGSAGIGWALARLATGLPPAAGLPTFGSASGAELSTEPASARWGALADAAFAFDELQYDATLGGWCDLRTPEQDVITAWCHGGGGMGVVAADLLARTGAARWRDVLRRAAAGCWTRGLDGNHTLCHGALGNWEVVGSAMAAGLGPAGLDRATLDAHVLSGLEDFGPSCGLATDTLEPGVMTGVSGIAYQLLRMHPDSRLPSLLLPDPGPARRPVDAGVPVAAAVSGVRDVLGRGEVL